MNSLFRKCEAISALLPYILLVMLCGCSNIIPHIEHHTSTQIEQPLVTPLQPYRVVQVCLDTPPLFSNRFFREAAVAIADRVDSSVTVNQFGLAVYVTLITHNSFQNDALQFSVPAFPTDPASPPPPTLGDDPYANAQAQSDYQKAFAAWQEALISQHHKLALLRAQVKKWTDTLRSLPAPFDNTGADVYGCLQDASQHFKDVAGEKFILIASALVNNTLLQVSRNISLAGSTIKIIWHTCVPEVASTCQANDDNWRHILLNFGARSVTFFDVAQSEVEKPTF